MFYQQLCVNIGAVLLTLHHNIRHIIHKNEHNTCTGRRTVLNWQQTTHKVACCGKLVHVSTHAIDREGYCLDPENNLNVTFLHKETCGFRVLNT